MKMLQAAILKVKAQRETNLFSDLLHLLHLLQLGGVFLDFLQSHVCAQPHQVPQAWTNAHSYFLYPLHSDQWISIIWCWSTVLLRVV